MTSIRSMMRGWLTRTDGSAAVEAMLIMILIVIAVGTATPIIFQMISLTFGRAAVVISQPFH
jgi:hypothetical protein